MCDTTNSEQDCRCLLCVINQSTSCRLGKSQEKKFKALNKNCDCGNADCVFAVNLAYYEHATYIEQKKNTLLCDLSERFEKLLKTSEKINAVSKQLLKTNEKLISENKTIIKTARNKKNKNRKLRNKISKFKEKLECKICLEQEACVVFEPCGHISCSICSVKLNECHICRSKILKRVHFFS